MSYQTEIFKKHKLLYALVGSVSVFLLIFIVSSFWIGYEANQNCGNAKLEYGGDCVNALISQLEDEDKDFRTRNHAVWTLGQMGNGRALPVLQKYYTGIIPDKEPLDTVISQYELKKAINPTNGGVNLTTFFWRDIFIEK